MAVLLTQVEEATRRAGARPVYRGENMSSNSCNRGFYASSCPEPVNVTVNQNIISFENAPSIFQVEFFSYDAGHLDNQLFTLVHFPYEPRSVQVFLNSGAQRYGIDFRVTGQKVFLLNPLTPGDGIAVHYMRVGGSLPSQAGGLGSIVYSVATVSSSIFTLANSIKVNKHLHDKDINNILVNSDIINTIKLLQAVISEIPEYYINSISVVMALKNVQEIIESIEDELKDIHTKTNYNQNLYLMSNWRSYDYKDNLESINNKIKILDRRKDNLFKILEVFKNLDIKNTEDNKNKIKEYLDNYEINEFIKIK
jgi:hypothetical protein